MEPKKFQSWLKAHLRTASKYWPEKTKVYHRVKQGRGEYKCEACGIVLPQKQLQIDHIEPVIDITGFHDWNTYIERLFCDSSKLQALCKPCHMNKSRIENEKRRLFKTNKKKR
jgi:hypothetical protein